MTDFAGLLGALVRSEVRFIIVGGVAATIHGSSRLTQDIDVVYDRSPDNVKRLADALETLSPQLRGAPSGLPFRFDPPTISRGMNFTLRTDLGDIDLFGEIPGGGGYKDLQGHTIEVTIFGLQCKSLDLPTLIRVKKAAGRARDLETVAELERIQEEEKNF